MHFQGFGNTTLPHCVRRGERDEWVPGRLASS